MASLIENRLLLNLKSKETYPNNGRGSSREEKLNKDCYD
jgi:hypothetical protein